MKPKQIFVPLLAAITLTGLAAPVLAQAKPASAKPDPKVKAQLKAYEKILKDKKNRKGDRDKEAVKIINSVLGVFPSLHPKDKKDFVKTLGKTLKLARRNATNHSIYLTVTLALGQTGSLGSKELQKIYNDKNLTKGGKAKKDWFPLRAKVLQQIGKTKDEKAIDFLTDEALKNAESDDLMAAAGRALGHFADSDLKLRKVIVKDLHKKLNQIYNMANANLDPGDLQRATWEKRYATVASPWNETLQKLTRQKFTNPTEWQKFWNNHKSKNWDKMKSK